MQTKWRACLPRCRREPWAYPGQFAFELAPLAIHYDLDDSAVRALPDYPKDLVDFGRSLRP